MKSACVAAALFLIALSAGAAGKAPVAFTHNDWELACDNTLTCRAAGYQADTGEHQQVSMLIIRVAGPDTALDVQLQIGDDDGVKGTLRFKVGKATVSGLEAGTASFTGSQVRAVLPELLKGDEATVTADGGKKWTLSLAGLNAVLLKMDETQGRVGTPGALVRKGARPESSVLPPVPMPVVNVPKPPKARPGDDALAARIFPSLDLKDALEQCNNQEQVSAKSIEVNRLNERKVLLSLGCGVGAYNYATLLWIANDKPPYAPVSLEASGEFSDKDASVSSSMKGRGVGDCWSTETWNFNGKDFVRTGATGDGMCRGFAGGAWALPRYVSRVVVTAPAATPSKP